MSDSAEELRRSAIADMEDPLRHVKAGLARGRPWPYVACLVESSPKNFDFNIRLFYHDPRFFLPLTSFSHLNCWYPENSLLRDPISGMEHTYSVHKRVEFEQFLVRVIEWHMANIKKGKNRHVIQKKLKFFFTT